MATVQEAEQQLAEAQLAEKQAAKDAAERQKEADRVMRAREQNAAGEIRAISARLDKAIASPRPASRPAGEIRGLARRFLHQGISESATDYPFLERLCSDAPFGLLYGINGQAGRMMQTIGIRDENLVAELDRVEAKSWEQLIERARELAGEVA